MSWSLGEKFSYMDAFEAVSFNLMLLMQTWSCAVQYEIMVLLEISTMQHTFCLLSCKRMSSTCSFTVQKETRFLKPFDILLHFPCLEQRHQGIQTEFWTAGLVASVFRIRITHKERAAPLESQ
jgi:hypothetical protein